MIEIQLDINVGFDFGQLARFTNQLGVVAQRFAIAFVLDLFPMLERVVDRAVILNDLHRTFWSNARRAGNVVDRISHQAQQIDELVGRHTKLLRHPGFVAPFDRRHGFFSFHHLRVLSHANDQRIAHQLAHIFVIGNYDGLQALVRGLQCQRSNDVVGFKTRSAYHRNVVGFAESFDVGQLRSKIVGHLLPISFVITEGLVAESLFLRFKNRGNVFWLLILQELAQHIREDVNRLRHLAFAVH